MAGGTLLNCERLLAPDAGEPLEYENSKALGGEFSTTRTGSAWNPGREAILGTNDSCQSGNIQERIGTTSAPANASVQTKWRTAAPALRDARTAKPPREQIVT